MSLRETSQERQSDEQQQKQDGERMLEQQISIAIATSIMREKLEC
jgi:hypothetical protein